MGAGRRAGVGVPAKLWLTVQRVSLKGLGLAVAEPVVHLRQKLLGRVVAETFSLMEGIPGRWMRLTSTGMMR